MTDDDEASQLMRCSCWNGVVSGAAEVGASHVRQPNPSPLNSLNSNTCSAESAELRDTHNNYTGELPKGKPFIRVQVVLIYGFWYPKRARKTFKEKYLDPQKRVPRKPNYPLSTCCSLNNPKTLRERHNA